MSLVIVFDEAIGPIIASNTITWRSIQEANSASIIDGRAIGEAQRRVSVNGRWVSKDYLNLSSLRPHPFLKTFLLSKAIYTLAAKIAYEKNTFLFDGINELLNFAIHMQARAPETKRLIKNVTIQSTDSRLACVMLAPYEFKIFKELASPDVPRIDHVYRILSGVKVITLHASVRKYEVMLTYRQRFNMQRLFEVGERIQIRLQIPNHFAAEKHRRELLILPRELRKLLWPQFFFRAFLKKCATKKNRQ